MTEAVIGLTVAYVALAALVVALNIYSRWHWWIKALTIIGVCGLYFLTYDSLKGLLGWPVRAELPDRFMLLASYITEPNKTTGADGVIHIWATSLTGHKPAAQPRAYQLEYDADLHGQLAQADQQIRRGIIQLGRKDETAPAGEAADRSRFNRPQARILIYDLPDPELPEK